MLDRRRFFWASERWKTRRGKLYLTPGDSAAGYRLPLSSLRWLLEEDRPYMHPLDPFAPRAPLARRTAMQGRGGTGVNPQAGAVGQWAPGFGPGGSPAQPGHTPMPVPGEVHPEAAMNTTWEPDPGVAIYASVVRTAITVEPRDGVLHIFMPPLPSADSFVDLVAAIEEAAEATGLPVQMEGYSPPTDHRMQKIMVTPDPGVVEVNVQPAESWEELVAISEGLYEDARHCHLATTKFLYDGRQAGSGGGNQRRRNNTRRQQPAGMVRSSTRRRRRHNSLCEWRRCRVTCGTRCRRAPIARLHLQRVYQVASSLGVHDGQAR